MHFNNRWCSLVHWSVIRSSHFPLLWKLQKVSGEAFAKLSCWTWRGNDHPGCLIPVKFPSFCLLTNLTALHKQCFRGYTNMWAAACFPSILGVHLRKSEYVSLLNAVRRPHSVPGDPRGNLSILVVTSSIRVYFSLVMLSKANNRMIHKDGQMLQGIKSLVLLDL